MDAKFFIGQKVVSLADYFFVTNIRIKFLTKGKIYTILDQIVGNCGCCYVVRVTNSTNDIFEMYCSTCNKVSTTDNAPYFGEDRFAPLQDIGNMTFEDAINLVEPKRTLHDVLKLK